jgi:hypothetical protein
VYQHRDNALSLFERRLNLYADEVARIVQPSHVSCIACIDPVLANDDEHDIALCNLFINETHKVDPGPDAVHIHEQLFGRECLL